MNAPKLPVHAEAGVVIGGYELVRRIGRGGMAEVWVARRALGRKGSKFVAIKLIADHHVGDERYSRMFKAEAELAAVLSHANIVQVFDEGEDHGRSFLIMEWVDGLNLLKLAAVLALLDDSDRRFRVTAYIIGQLLYALKYAHSITSFDGSPLGIVHRDVSPQNVLVSNHGEVKLTDFGVACHAMEESSGLHVKGKVRYMSPEQLSGKTRSPTVDLYAVGALLHELLDGKKFRGEYDDGQDMFNAVLGGVVPPLTRTAPPELDDLRLGLLAPDPAERIQSAEDALEWLKRYPGYGDARDELTKLCSGLTGIVRPRVGPGRSSPVRAASRSPKPKLAKPRVSLPPAPAAPPAPPAPGVRTTATTAVAQGRSATPPVISGHTEFVGPDAVGPSPGSPLALSPAPSHPIPLYPAPAHVQAQGSRPIPYGPPQGTQPLGHPGPPLASHPATHHGMGHGGPAFAPTQPLGYGPPLGPQPIVTEPLDANVFVEPAPGSGTDQEPVPAVGWHEGSDTAREPPARPSTHSHPIPVRRPRRATIPLVVLGLIAVALGSVTLTWWLFTNKDGGSTGPVPVGVAAAASHDDAAPTRRDPPVDPTPTTPPGLHAPGEAPSEPPAPEVPPSAPVTDDELAPPEAEAEATELPEPDAIEDDDADTDEPIEVEADAAAKPKKALVVVKAVFGMQGAQVKVGSTVMTIPPVARSVKRRFPPGTRKLAWRPSEADAWRPAGSVALRSGRTTTLLMNATRGVLER